MHSLASLLRKPTSQTPSFAARGLKSRTISRKSNNPIILKSSSGNGGRSNCSCSDDQFESSFFRSLLRSVCCGTVVVGISGLGLFYCSSSIFGSDSMVSYADSGTNLREQEKKLGGFLFKDAYRRKVFFKYEKRIRTRSPPEKVISFSSACLNSSPIMEEQSLKYLHDITYRLVFEYFATFRTSSGEIYMTPVDLMRAVVPVFPPSEAHSVRVGNLAGEWTTSDLHFAPSKFFMLFDTNNDGLISFPEYIFFVTLLSIPESSFSVAFRMFDLDNDGGIDKQEFQKVMNLMRTQNRQGANHRDGMRIGLKVSGSVEDGGLLEYFFGKDGKGRLEHQKFVQFFRKLHDEILRLEFSHYDFKSQGTICAKDFALSMVASADMRYVNKFLDRVDELNNETSLRDVRITFEEFKKFAELRKRLEPFSIALFSYGKVNGLLSKQDFKRAADQVCGINLTENVVNLIFFMFDTNRDGSLSSDEFLRVLERRENDISQPREAGFAGLISCWLDCSKTRSSKMF